jgi:hypothetical protein
MARIPGLADVQPAPPEFIPQANVTVRIAAARPVPAGRGLAKIFIPNAPAVTIGGPLLSREPRLRLGLGPRQSRLRLLAVINRRRIIVWTSAAKTGPNSTQRSAAQRFLLLSVGMALVFPEILT